MLITATVKINAKFLASSFPSLSHSPPVLYINRNLALPSLCKALHNDGWGESFEQHEISTRDEDIYVSFRNMDDEYFLKPESEVFPEPNYEMKFGG